MDLSKDDIRSIVIKHSEDIKEIDLSLIDNDVKGAASLPFHSAMEQLSLVCGDKSFIDPKWGLLAGRLLMESYHRQVPATFSEAMKKMEASLLPEFSVWLDGNAKKLDESVRMENDFSHDVFSVATLRKSYLGQIKGPSGATELVESPQYLYMRVAAYLYHPNIPEIQKVYSRLSNGEYSHASPTMFNGGIASMTSCFLMTTPDSLKGLARSWAQQARISQLGGGEGVDFSQLRTTEIGRDNRAGGGVIPWCKITNEVLKAVNQSGKRKGAGAGYMNMWHDNIFEFIELRDEGPEDLRAKDLFLGVMIPDIFMRRVKANEIWSLFCPNKVKGMADLWGEKFEEAYCTHEKNGMFTKQVKARDLWMTYLKMCIKKGMPYAIFSDAANRKSNQRHSGTIRCSNLCAEILEVTSEKEIASCNLASIVLNKCVDYSVAKEKYVFNFDRLEELTAELVTNINQVIDRNFYPEDVPEIKYSNLKHRPIGLGVQGLADTFALLDIPWVAPDDKGVLRLTASARKLNDQIFETIYFSAIKASAYIAKSRGAYETFKGSPASYGLFQQDLWELERISLARKSRTAEPNEVRLETSDTTKKRKLNDGRSDAASPVSFNNLNIDGNLEDIDLEALKAQSRPRKSRYTNEQWELLRKDMMAGLHNSLSIALMPTASSAHILGNNESFEPFNELIYARTVMSGQFLIVNKHMVRDLRAIGMWNTETVRGIIQNRGSMQNVSAPPNSSPEKIERLEELKLKYLTVYEIPQKALLQLSIDRAKYICQTQSLNCFMDKPTRTKLNAWFFYGWSRGLKTGMYYLRQKAGQDPINMALNSIVIPTAKRGKPKNVVCSDDVCLVCQS